jgi:hypothetical protein
MDPVRITIARELMLFIGLCIGMKLIGTVVGFVATRWFPSSAPGTVSE